MNTHDAMIDTGKNEIPMWILSLALGLVVYVLLYRKY
jgi:uncharacterized membrane protein YozB (DUF420 family)